jgi:hypothetical protein
MLKGDAEELCKPKSYTRIVYYIRLHGGFGQTGCE